MFLYAWIAPLVATSYDWFKSAWRQVAWCHAVGSLSFIIVGSSFGFHHRVRFTNGSTTYSGACVVSCSLVLVSVGLQKRWPFIGIICGYFMDLFFLSVPINCWVFHVSILNSRRASECKLSIMCIQHPVCVSQCEFWMKFCHHTVSYFSKVSLKPSRKVYIFKER